MGTTNVSDIASSIKEATSTTSVDAATLESIVNADNTESTEEDIATTTNTNIDTNTEVTDTNSTITNKSTLNTGPIYVESDTSNTTITLATIDPSASHTPTTGSSSVAQIDTLGNNKVTPTEIPVDKLIEKIKFYLNVYLKVNTSNIKRFTNPSESLIVGKAFRDIVTITYDSNHPAVYQEVYTFFANNRNGILKEQYALTGVNYLSSKEEMMKCQIFYHVFMNITDPQRKAKSLNIDLLRSVFIGNKGESLISYVVLKSSKK